MTSIEQKIEGIVDSILADYLQGRDIDRIEPFRHPDKDVIIDIIDQRNKKNNANPRGRSFGNIYRPRWRGDIQKILPYW